MMTFLHWRKFYPLIITTIQRYMQLGLAKILSHESFRLYGTCTVVSERKGSWRCTLHWLKLCGLTFKVTVVRVQSNANSAQYCWLSTLYQCKPLCSCVICTLQCVLTCLTVSLGLLDKWKFPIYSACARCVVFQIKSHQWEIGGWAGNPQWALFCETTVYDMLIIGDLFFFCLVAELYCRTGNPPIEEVKVQ